MNRPAPSTLEELKQFVAAEVQQHKTELQAQRRQELPLTTLIWLALPPGWTLDAAHLFSKHDLAPKEFHEGEKFFERLVESGLFERHEALTFPGDDPPEPDLFSMRESERVQIIEDFRTRVLPGSKEHEQWAQRDFLQRLLSSSKNQNETLLPQVLYVLGSTFQQAKASEVTPKIERWAELAAQANEAEAMNEDLASRMLEAYNKNSPGQIKLWINSAKELQIALAGTQRAALERTVRRAGLYLELLDRARHDEHHLKNFLKRPEQIEQVNSLLNGPDELWATHFIGAGGVGKTMLVRYITSQRSRKEDWNVFTARIDFDYINPNYPRLDPGLMLWSFAQELRAYDESGRATELFDEADRLFKRIHEELRAGTAEVKFGTEHSLFARALHVYIDALNSLSKPVLLIVDTCEELAKAGPWTTAQENVNETFRILRAIHDGPGVLENPDAKSTGGVPQLRVIFAGRRPLAQSGYGWQSKSSTLDAQEFLQLFEIRGFDFEDAEKYLASVEVPAHLIRPIIRKSSPDAGSVAEITWDDPRQAPPEKDRCNPYDLRLFIDWAREKPPPSADAIEDATSEQYVELRILRRLENETLKELLPLLALTKFCNQQLLQVMLPELSEAGVTDLFQNLQRQEWIERRNVGVESKTQVLYIEEGLRLRLMEYFKERSDEYRTTIERIAVYLEKRTLEEDLADLETVDFDIALRVMEQDPGRAYAWWKQVEARFFTERLEGNPEWIKSTIDFLAGEEGAVAHFDVDRGARAQPESILRPMVLATQAAALLRMGDKMPPTDLWKEVDEKLKAHPIPGGEMLALRADAGSVNPNVFRPKLIQFLEVVSDPVNWQEPETIAAWVSAGEELLEHLQEKGSYLESNDASLFEKLAGLIVEMLAALDSVENLFVDDLRGFGYTLVGRLAASIGDFGDAQFAMRKALQLADLLADQEASRNWAYWIPPEDLTARIRLEAARCLYPFVMSAKETLMLLAGDQKPAPSISSNLAISSKEPPNLSPFDPESLLARFMGGSRASSIDEDRLRAFIYQLILCEKLPSTSPNAEKEFGDDLAWIVDFRCNAHWGVPPAFVVEAEVLAAQGRINEALALLRKAQDDERFPLEIKLHVDRMLTRIIIRYRLRDEGEAGGSFVGESSELNDLELYLTLNGLDGGKGIFEDDKLQTLSLAHVFWRGRFALDSSAEVENLLDFVKDHWDRLGDEFLSVENEADHSLGVGILLDLKEAELLKQRWKSKFSGLPSTKKISEDTSLSPEAIPNPVDKLVSNLRLQALWSSPVDLTDTAEEKGWDLIDESLVSLVGTRRTAELALHQGNLLSLKLPKQAAVLYKFAYTQFTACRDRVGAAIAAAAMAGTIPQGNKSERYDHPMATGFMDAYKELRTYLGPGEKDTPGEALENLGQLNDWTGKEIQEFLDAQPRAWRPWMTRLLGVRLWYLRDLQTELVRYGIGEIERKWPRLAKVLRIVLRPFGWGGKDPLERYFGLISFFLKAFSVIMPERLSLLGMPANARLDDMERTFKNWVVDHYGSVVEGRTALPSDFTYLLDDEAEEKEEETKGLEKRKKEAKGGDVYRGGEAESSVPVPSPDPQRQPVTPPAAEGPSSPQDIVFEQGPESPRTPVSAPKTRAGASWIQSTLLFILGLAVWAGLFAGLYYLVQRFMPEAVLSVLGVWGALGIVVALVVVCAVVVVQLRKVWNSRYSLEVQIEEEVEPQRTKSQRTKSRPRSRQHFEEKLLGNLTFHFKRPQLSIWWPFISRASATKRLKEIPLDAIIDYDRVADTLSEMLPEEILEEFPADVSTPYHVSISANARAQAFAWEAICSRALRRPDLSIHRVTPSIVSHPFGRIEGKPRIQSVVGDRLAQEAAQSGFSTISNAFDFDVTGRGTYREITQNLHFPIKEVNYDILHLIGSAEERSEGLRFRVPNYETSQTQMQKFQPLDLGEFYLDPERLVNSVNVQVCILQEELIQTEIKRSTSDRLKASMARMFAAQLSEQGIPVVIYLPAMGMDSAVPALQELAGVLKARPKAGTRSLLLALQQIRKIIAKDKFASEESSFDACLFCAEDWNARKAL